MSQSPGSTASSRLWRHFPARRESKLKLLIVRTGGIVRLWRHLPDRRESKLKHTLNSGRLRSLCFGDTFPGEGNRNRTTLIHSCTPRGFGDTFPLQGDRNKSITMNPKAHRSLWRHFPAARESKLQRLHDRHTPNDLWRHFPSGKKWKRKGERVWNRGSSIFGDTFPREGNGNFSLSLYHS